MAPSLLSDPQIRKRLPRLTEYLDDRQLAAREQEFERLGLVPLWQVERDLELLIRYAPGAEIRRAYQDLLRNRGQFVDVMYEIRVAAMLAPFVDELELAPLVGGGRCDARCVIGGRDVFVEVTATSDPFPWRREELKRDPPPDVALPRSRATDETPVDPGTASDGLETRLVPRSKELAARVVQKRGQLPPDEMTVVVVGETAGHSLNMEEALEGTERFRLRDVRLERAPDGLFAGASRPSAVVWMRLGRRWNDIKVRSRLFTNPRAEPSLSPEAEAVFRKLFDRRAVLEAECARINALLVEKFAPTRIILFGSLASNSPDAVHQWSDLDLVVVKATTKGFAERVREVMALVEPRVGINLLVYTPEEADAMKRAGSTFWREEISKKGRVLFPADG